MTSKKSSNDHSLTPLSHCIIALSSAYHEYIPLTIHNLHSLVLLSGIDCLLTNLPEGNDESVHVLPVSKTTIVGTIVYCQYKSNCSMSLVIDDGTDLCDCTGWIQEDDMDKYCVGNLVKIQGFIKILSLKEKEKSIKVAEKFYEAWSCIRELQIHSINIIMDKNEEILHWLQCMQFRKSIGMKMDIDDILDCNNDDDDDDEQQMMNTPVLNGFETFNLLPETHQQQILASRGFEELDVLPNEIDRMLRKYFGRDCRCIVSYKDDLLYCHCMASKEPLDPEFKFRDALLEKLIQMEHAFVHRNNASRLEFLYQIVVDDQELRSISSEVVASTAYPEINQRRLYTNTFKMLRKDGVLCLVNIQKDIYVLLSKNRVLIPAAIAQIQDERCADVNGNTKHHHRKQSFLEKGISSSKLRLIKYLAYRELEK